MAAIASATDYPIEYFVRHRGDVEAVAFFRSLRSAPARERKRALAWAHLLHDFTTVLDDHLQLPSVDVPLFHIEASDSVDEVEELAKAVRSKWDLADGPIPNVVAELERHGVVTAALPLKRHDLDAFSVWFAERPMVILGNDKHVAGRSRFDAAHELGHLALHQPEEAGTKLAEPQAHRFAAAFLMPADTIGERLPATADWRRLLELKVEWGVSLAALLMRAKTLGILSQHRYIGAVKQMSARGWRRAEPGDNQLGPPAGVPQLEGVSGYSLTRMCWSGRCGVV